MSKLRNEMALSKEIEIEETDVVAQYAQKYASSHRSDRNEPTSGR